MAWSRSTRRLAYTGGDTSPNIDADVVIVVAAMAAVPQVESVLVVDTAIALGPAIANTQAVRPCIAMAVDTSKSGQACQSDTEHNEHVAIVGQLAKLAQFDR